VLDLALGAGVLGFQALVLLLQALQLPLEVGLALGLSSEGLDLSLVARNLLLVFSDFGFEAGVAAGVA
jgi:hypothetical protein